MPSGELPRQLISQPSVGFDPLLTGRVQRPSAMAAMPDLASRVGWRASGLLALGGAFYSAGAAVYAFRRPDPAPEVFGYHEVFHALVVAAALSHYAMVALYVIPAA